MTDTPAPRLPANVRCVLHDRAACGRRLCRERWAETLRRREDRLAAAADKNLSVPDLMLERDYWMGRARRAEERLRWIAPHLLSAATQMGQAVGILKVWRDPVKEGEDA